MEGGFYVQVSDGRTRCEEILPEIKLWRAVILTIVDDYREALKQIRKAVGYGERANIKLLWQIQKFRNEIGSEFIGEICEYIGVANTHIARRLKELDRDAGLEKVKWISREEAEFEGKNGKNMPVN